MGINLFAIDLVPCLKGCSFWRQCLCVYCVWSSREDIIAVSWPISLPQPAAPLWLWDAYWALTLSLTLLRHPPILQRHTSITACLGSFFPPLCPLGLVFCFFLPQLLSFPSFFSLSLPPFTCHLSSLSHLVCNHFVICGPACCHCIMWVIVTIMVMMTVICHIKMFTSAFRRHSKWVQIGEWYHRPRMCS